METLVPPDMSGLERLWRQSQHAERAAESGAYARWLGKPMAAIDLVSERWADIRRSWNEIAAVEAAAEAGRHVRSTDKLKTSLTGVESLNSDAVKLWSRY